MCKNQRYVSPVVQLSSPLNSNHRTKSTVELPIRWQGGLAILHCSCMWYIGVEFFEVLCGAHTFFPTTDSQRA